MTPEELKAERAALSRAIEQRQKQIDADEMQQWCAEREAAKGGNSSTSPVTRSAPAPRAPATPEPNHGGRELFTPAEMRLLEALTAAVGQKLAELRDSQQQQRQEIRQELQDFTRREIDKTAQRLRSEALQSQLDFERSLRATEQQRHQRTSSLRVDEMIEINPRHDMN